MNTHNSLFILALAALAFLGCANAPSTSRP
jgi:hypothetical protein